MKITECAVPRTSSFAILVVMPWMWTWARCRTRTLAACRLAFVSASFFSFSLCFFAACKRFNSSGFMGLNSTAASSYGFLHAGHLPLRLALMWCQQKRQIWMCKTRGQLHRVDGLSACIPPDIHTSKGRSSGRQRRACRGIAGTRRRPEGDQMGSAL